MQDTQQGSSCCVTDLHGKLLGGGGAAEVDSAAVDGSSGDDDAADRKAGDVAMQDGNGEGDD